MSFKPKRVKCKISASAKCKKCKEIVIDNQLNYLDLRITHTHKDCSFDIHSKDTQAVLTITFKSDTT